MLRRLIWNDIRQNKLMSAATIFFMALSAALLALTVLLCTNLLGAIDGLMDNARVPDFMQMHAGEVDERALAGFAAGSPEVEDWQICRFLNLDNSRLTLSGHSLADSTQDNGLSVQGERFDFLLDMDGRLLEVFPGEVYVPIAYRARYGVSPGDTMEIGERTLTVAGFIRDAQMNSMMASSKRFLVCAADYAKLADQGQEEYLIEFLLHDGADTNAFQSDYDGRGLPSNGPAITRPLIRMMNALSDGTMILVIFLVGMVVLLISILCIHFILALQMERDRKEMGMLKALGIGRREIRRIYFSKYLLFAACGTPMGLITAAILQEPLAGQLRKLYGSAGQGISQGIASLLAALTAVGLILLSVQKSLKKTDRLSALDALFQNQERGKGSRPYLLIGAVTAACTFLMLVPKNLYHTLSSPAFVTYMGIGGGELRMDVRQRADIDGVTAQIAAALERDAQVEKYTVLKTGSYSAVLPDGETTGLLVEMGNHLIFPVSFLRGEPPAGDGEIALSSLNAADLGLSVGDSLDLTMEGEAVPYSVCGIYSDITNGGRTAKISDRPGAAPVIWSVLYVTLKEDADREEWIKQYRKTGADVTDIADYVQDTYAQTLAQLNLASRAAAGIAMPVIAVVLMLFLRLIVERNRYAISLHKALGFTGEELKRACFFKGLLPAGAGIPAGIILGNLLGESLCGIILKSFGADGFRFVIDWGWMLAGIPALALGPAVLAIWAGIAGIRQIKAFECCTGKE